jgi:hypothetical protein
VGQLVGLSYDECLPESTGFRLRFRPQLLALVVVVVVVI